MARVTNTEPSKIRFLALMGQINLNFGSPRWDLFKYITAAPPVKPFPTPERPPEPASRAVKSTPLGGAD